MLTYIFTYTYILTWGTTGKITLNAFATSSIFCIALLLSVSRKLVSPGNSQRATRSMTIGRNSLIIGKVYGGAKRHCESLSSTADFATFSGLHAYCSKIFVSSNWFSARIELWKWRTVPGRSIARGLYRSSSTRSIMVVIGTSFSIAAVDRTPGQDLSSKGTKKKLSACRRRFVQLHKLRQQKCSARTMKYRHPNWRCRAFLLNHELLEVTRHQK